MSQLPDVNRNLKVDKHDIQLATHGEEKSWTDQN